MTDREYLQLVASMRECQKEFFAGDRTPATLMRAKELERRVDAETHRRLHPERVTRSLFAGDLGGEG